MRRTFVILVVVCYVCTGTKGRKEDHGTICRYWCRTNDHRYYCCPSGKQKDWINYSWHAISYPWLWIVAAATELLPFHSRWPEASVTESATRKHCPPLRTHCPRSYDWYMPPISCDADDDCSKSQKCCYDVCLEHEICKLAE